MHILVTNDDGVSAPGLAALAAALRQASLGGITVLAPDHNWSASGHVKTLHKPLRVRRSWLQDGTEALAATGAPSDCVALAFLGVVKEKIDVVVSGVNPYLNLGHDVTYSGTVTAAMEAAIWRAPAIAISTDTVRRDDYTPAARAAARIVRRVAERGLPPYSLLNVNVPGLPEAEIRGTRITRQGLRIYRDELVERFDPRGEPYYWIGGDIPTGVPDEGTDFAALADGYISITPLHLDLTAHQLIDTLRDWNF